MCSYGGLPKVINLKLQKENYFFYYYFFLNYFFNHGNVINAFKCHCMNQVNFAKCIHYFSANTLRIIIKCRQNNLYTLLDV